MAREVHELRARLSSSPNTCTPLSNTLHEAGEVGILAREGALSEHLPPSVYIGSQNVYSPLLVLAGVLSVGGRWLGAGEECGCDGVAIER